MKIPELSQKGLQWRAVPAHFPGPLTFRVTLQSQKSLQVALSTRSPQLRIKKKKKKNSKITPTIKYKII